MNKYNFLFLITICLFSCQKQTNEFYINGEIEAGVDSINMYPGFIAKDFLDIYLQNGFKSKVDNGKFFFKDN